MERQPGAQWGRDAGAEASTSGRREEEEGTPPRAGETAERPLPHGGPSGGVPAAATSALHVPGRPASAAAGEHERRAADMQNGFAQHGAAGAGEDLEEGSSEEETDYEEEEEEEDEADGEGPGVVIDAGTQGDAPLELLRGAGVSFGPIQRPITTLLSLSAFRARLGSPRSASPAAPAQAPPPEPSCADTTADEGPAGASAVQPGAPASRGNEDPAGGVATSAELAGTAAGAAAPEHAEARTGTAEDGSLRHLQASEHGREASAAGRSCVGGEVQLHREEPAEAGSLQRVQSSEEALCTPAAACCSSGEEHAGGEGDAGSPAASCEERCGRGAQEQPQPSLGEAEEPKLQAATSADQNSSCSRAAHAFQNHHTDALSGLWAKEGDLLLARGALQGFLRQTGLFRHYALVPVQNGVCGEHAGDDAGACCVDGIREQGSCEQAAELSDGCVLRLVLEPLPLK